MILRYLPIYVLIAVVSILHYATGKETHALHDVYRRLYYIPIILAAFAGGVRGGILAAVVICIVYYPHAFGHITHDPGRPIEKILEMVLYVVVGGVTGFLVSREGRTQDRLRETAGSLAETLAEKERMEEELIRAAKLAAVGKLSAGLAHEIRNPLTSIKGSAELLGDDFPDGHPKKELLDTLVREADRLNGVLTRFLSFARPLPIDKRTFHPIEPIEEVVGLLTDRRGTEETEIVVHPPGEDIPEIEGDPERLRQVFLNVLLNAVQACGDRGGRVEIRFVREVGPERLRVEFDDSGSGFAVEALDNLFTPFFTTRSDGTGLGLAISHRIVESHGGRIIVVDGPGGGARVVVELPIRAA